ncbi:(2Fe-2S) ferredoxin domain-containing protein [Kitasatospora sp. NPDC093550]|uniref:(2Fe-2S) ferredoxin domain-containing protein n=1 Tax=Kitasatospora sp. NPDC093550 TaxID=3364089 RepID=UPI0038264AE5
MIRSRTGRERTGHRPELLVATRLADSPEAVTAVAPATKAVTGEEPGLTSAAWEDIPGHRHHVLVCRGPRCAARGAEETLRGLNRELAARGLGDDDVLVTQTGCLFPCHQAAVVTVQPDDVWYGGVDPDAAVLIATEHLAAGRPVDSHRLPRHRKESAERHDT